MPVRSLTHETILLLQFRRVVCRQRERVSRHSEFVSRDPVRRHVLRARRHRRVSGRGVVRRVSASRRHRRHGRRVRSIQPRLEAARRAAVSVRAAAAAAAPAAAAAAAAASRRQLSERGGRADPPQSRRPQPGGVGGPCVASSVRRGDVGQRPDARLVVVRRGSSWR